MGLSTRSLALGIVSNSLGIGIGVRRGVPSGGGGPQVRFATSLVSAAALTWAAGTTTTNLTDNLPGENATWVGLTAGVSQTAYVAGIYDLKTPQVITRCRYRYGTSNGNTYALSQKVEASTDGVNWVNADTSGLGAGEVAAGVFQWANERDITQITGTAYRYWRVVIQDTYADGNPDCRLSDFRLYTSGGIVL